MPDSCLRQFGDNLRSLREATGLSQEQLATAAGVHRNYVGLVERGERNTSLTRIVALCKALGSEPNDLFKGILG